MAVAALARLEVPVAGICRPLAPVRAQDSGGSHEVRGAGRRGVLLQRGRPVARGGEQGGSIRGRRRGLLQGAGAAPAHRPAAARHPVVPDLHRRLPGRAHHRHRDREDLLEHPARPPADRPASDRELPVRPGRRLARPGEHQPVPDRRDPDVRQGRQGADGQRQVAHGRRGGAAQGHAAHLRHHPHAARGTAAGLPGAGARGQRLQHRPRPREHRRGRWGRLRLVHAARRPAVVRPGADRPKVRARSALCGGLRQPGDAPPVPVEHSAPVPRHPARTERPAQPAHRQRVVRAQQEVFRQARQAGRHRVALAQPGRFVDADGRPRKRRPRGRDAGRHGVELPGAGPAQPRLRRGGRELLTGLRTVQSQPQRNGRRAEPAGHEPEPGVGLQAAHVRRDLGGAGATPTGRARAALRDGRAADPTRGEDGRNPICAGRTVDDAARADGQRRDVGHEPAGEGEPAPVRLQRDQEPAGRRHARAARAERARGGEGDLRHDRLPRWRPILHLGRRRPGRVATPADDRAAAAAARGQDPA